MEGLLGKIGQLGKGIGGLLGNPMVQGAAMAAVGGVNPLLGLLLGPGIKNDRERRELQNQMARETVTAARRRNQAADQLRGLLGDSENVIGPRRAIEGLDGEMIGLPGRMHQVPTIQTPDGQQKMLGLLAQSSPDVFANVATQGLLGPQSAERAAPADIRIMQQLGIPTTPEGFQQFQALKNQSDPADQARLASLVQGQQLTALQIEEMQRERQEAIEAKAQERAVAAVDYSQTLKQGKGILDTVKSLEGTFLEPGKVGAGWRRGLTSLGAEAAELFGKDDFAKEQRELIGQYDIFRKDAYGFVLNMANQGARVTDFQLETLQRANAGEDVSPTAILSVVSDVLEQTLAEAEAKRIEIPSAQRKEMREILAGLKKQASSKGGEVKELPNGVTIEYLD